MRSLLALLLCSAAVSAQDGKLHVGFGQADVSPTIGAKPVYLAGFGKNRLATALHDPIMARAVVLQHHKQKIAMIGVDVVGLFLPVIERIRGQLPGFDYVLVSATHNHEGPDTLGLWGPSLFQSGVDPAYLAHVEKGIVRAVKDADAKLQTVSQVRLGTAKGPELLHDNRLPTVKHDDLVVVQFLGAMDQSLGLIVQWNCHPETLDDKNTEVSADFVGYVVGSLEKHTRAPTVYLTGTVGGLMTSLHVPVRDAAGKELADGTFAKTQRYGELVGELAKRALAKSERIELTPIAAHRRDVFLPLDNFAYQVGYQTGVLDRPAYVWTGDATRADPVDRKKLPPKLCVKTEVGYLRLGELEVAAIPGEIYPELVLGKVQDPADPAADFADAPAEPGIYSNFKAKHKMIVGLANDELGYFIPKRQWDARPPFCFGRQSSQYGEVNSLGPETSPLLCAAFAELVKRANAK